VKTNPNAEANVIQSHIRNQRKKKMEEMRIKNDTKRDTIKRKNQYN